MYHFSNFQRSRVVNSDSRENYHDQAGSMQAGRTLFLLLRSERNRRAETYDKSVFKKNI